MKEPTSVPPPALTAYHFVLRHPKLEPSQRPRLVNYTNNVPSIPVAFDGEVRPTAFVGGKSALAKTLVDRYTKLGWVDVTKRFRAWQQEQEAAALAPDTAGAPMLPASTSGEVEPPAQAAGPKKADALVPVDTADEAKGPAQEERPPVLSERGPKKAPEAPQEKPPGDGAELGGHRPPETASSMTRDLPANGRGVPPETPSRGKGGGKGGKAKRTPGNEAPAPPAGG